MKRLSMVLTIALLLPLLVWSAAAVSAATLTGTADCSLEATSVAADGSTILDQGTVQNGTTPEGSQEDPFDVAWDGRVDFRFQSGTTVFENNEWAVYPLGLPIPILAGSDDNPGDLDEVGNVRVGPPGLPQIVGTIYVSGYLEGNNGTARCDGNGWVRIVGDPVGTVPWILMIALILIGAAFLVATPYTQDWEEGRHTPWDGNVPSPRPEA